MKQISPVDTFLLKKFQQISNWSQDWFGYDNFKLARFLRIIMLCFFVLRGLFIFLQDKMSGGGKAILCMFVLLMLGAEFMLQTTEKRVRSNPELPNQAAVIYQMPRFMLRFLALFALCNLYPHVLDLIHLSKIKEPLYHNYEMVCSSLADLFLISVFYLASCTPRPYKPGRIKVWLSKIRK